MRMFTALRIPALTDELTHKVRRSIHCATSRQVKDCTGTERTVIGREPSNEPRNFFDRAQSIQRRSGNHGIDRIREILPDQIGVNRSGSDDWSAFGWMATLPALLQRLQ